MHAHACMQYLYRARSPRILLLFAGISNVELLLFPARSVVLLLPFNTTVTTESPLNVVVLYRCVV